MTTFKNTLLLISTLVLFGCATNKQSIQPDNTFVPPPSELLTDCKFVKPPNRLSYPYLDPSQKEEMLVDFGMELQKSLTLCQQKIKDLNIWVDSMSVGTGFITPNAAKKIIKQ
jgi:hypothetical protein